MRSAIRIAIDITFSLVVAAVCIVAFKDFFAGLIGGLIAQLYGLWCFCDGITPKKGMR